MAQTAVIIYTKAHCPYCDNAKTFFDANNVAYKVLRIDQDPQALAAMRTITNARTVPQIVINNRLIGGYTDLMTAFENEGLAALVGKSS